MTGAVFFIHVVICLLLALVILMQAGRGGGLTEHFSAAESIFGAQTNQFMVKATTILASLFFITCLTLAIVSTRKDKSLMTRQPLTTAPSPGLPPATSTTSENPKPGVVQQPQTSPAAPSPSESSLKTSGENSGETSGATSGESSAENSPEAIAPLEEAGKESGAMPHTGEHDDHAMSGTPQTEGPKAGPAAGQPAVQASPQPGEQHQSNP